jgi:hypothetical protein
MPSRKGLAGLMTLVSLAGLTCASPSLTNAILGGALLGGALLSDLLLDGALLTDSLLDGALLEEGVDESLLEELAIHLEQQYNEHCTIINMG